MTRTSTRIGCLPPTLSNSRSCSTRSNATWVSSASSPTSSRKIVPPSASSKRPIRVCMAPVNAPFSWQNNSDKNQFARNRGTIDADEWTRRTIGSPVDGTSHQFLARSRLPADENSGIACCDFRNPREYRRQSGRFPDYLLIHGGFIYLLPEGQVLLP